MCADIEQHEWIDLRRVVDRAVCDWALAGHCQTLQMILPAGPIHVFGNCARLRRLLLTHMERAARSANRLERMLLIVERIDGQVIIQVGIRSRTLFAVRVPPVELDSIVPSRPLRTVGEMPSSLPGRRV